MGNQQVEEAYLLAGLKSLISALISKRWRIPREPWSGEENRNLKFNQSPCRRARPGSK